ncbi:unnamed protein product [Urochloa humidicola]
MRIAPSSLGGSGSNVRARGGSRVGLRGRGSASGRGASSVGARYNKRCHLSLSSQTTEINQEQLEQDALEHDPNRVVEDNGVGEDETEHLVDEDLYERGPTLLPRVPREEDKVELTPVGDRQWREDFVSKDSRSPNGIIGLLIRRNYPGIVTYKGSRVAAHKVCHYSVVPEPTPNSTQQPTSALHKIETKFWYYFKWADGKEARAKTVVRNVIKKLIPNAFYEARLQSIIAYHRGLKVYISRSEACKMYPPVQDYMKAIPYWFATCPNAWRMLAELWNTPDWIAKSRAGRARKEKKLRIHRQGSASAARYQRNMEKKLKRPVPEIEAYLMARTEEGQDYADIDAHDNVMAYAQACEAIHGPDFEWDKEPIDGVAAYKAGHGKKHGRYLVGDGMINTTTVLNEVRVSSTTSELTGQTQPQQRRRLNPEEAQRIEQHMREEMEQKLQQEHEEMERKLQQEREDRERKLQQEREDMERKLQQKQDEMEQKLQREREAWECEIQPERDYYKSAISAITERLQIDLPPPPRPQQPVRATCAHMSTSNAASTPDTQDVFPATIGSSNAT